MNAEKKKVSEAQKRAQKKYDEKTKKVTLNFSPPRMPVYDKLKEYTNETGKSVNGFIIELIERFFENEKPAVTKALTQKFDRSNTSSDMPPIFYDKYSQYYCEFVDDEHIEILNGLFGGAVTEILLSEFNDNLGDGLDNIIETGGLQLEEWVEDIADRFDDDEQLQKIAAKYKNEATIKQYRGTDLETIIYDMFESVKPTIT